MKEIAHLGPEDVFGDTSVLSKEGVSDYQVHTQKTHTHTQTHKNNTHLPVCRCEACVIDLGPIYRWNSAASLFLIVLPPFFSPPPTSRSLDRRYT